MGTAEQIRDRIRARRRLLVSGTVGALLYLVLPRTLAWEVRTALAWDGAALTYLLLTLALAFRSRPDEMRRRAVHEDSTMLASVTIAGVSAILSIGAVVTLVIAAQGAPEPQRTLHLILGGVTLLLSWLLVHTMFAIHYAHVFYARSETDPDGAEQGGLIFPGEPAPDYFDFAYFSFVIGMTAQVADVGVASRELRRTALVHGIASFLFNTVILAFAVNIGASLI